MLANASENIRFHGTYHWILPVERWHFETNQVKTAHLLLLPSLGFCVDPGCSVTRTPAQESAILMHMKHRVYRQSSEQMRQKQSRQHWQHRLQQRSTQGSSTWQTQRQSSPQLSLHWGQGPDITQQLSPMSASVKPHSAAHPKYESQKYVIMSAFMTASSGECVKTPIFLLIFTFHVLKKGTTGCVC